MYACYTRLPCVEREEQFIDKERDSFDLCASSRLTSGLMCSPVDLSNSTSSPAFAWHMYDSPNSIFFQRRAIVDPVNSGISTLFHPVRNFWRASIVPFYYHLPITLRALNPAARTLLGELRGSRKQFFDRGLRLRIYAMSRRPHWLSKFGEYSSYPFDDVEERSAVRPLEYTPKRLLPFSSQNFLHECLSVEQNSRLPANERLVVHLLKSCSINYSHVSDKLLYVKLQIPVRALDDEDDGKYSLTSVDEMNELVVQGKIGGRFNQSGTFLDNERAYVNSLCDKDPRPWFDRQDAPLRTENYLNQHMLPFPTRNELYNAASISGMRNLDDVSEYGVPFNLCNLPLYSKTRKLVKSTKIHRKYARKHNLSIFASNFDKSYDCSKSLRISPIVETYENNERIGDQFRIKNYASLFTVGVNDCIREEAINDRVCKAFGSNTTYEYFTQPNTRSQLFYAISSTKPAGGFNATLPMQDNASGFGIGPRDVIFVVSLESVTGCFEKNS